MHGFPGALPLSLARLEANRCQRKVSGPCRGAVGIAQAQRVPTMRERRLDALVLDAAALARRTDRQVQAALLEGLAREQGLSALPGPKSSRQLQEAALPSSATISATAGRSLRTLPAGNCCLTGWPSSCQQDAEA